MSVTATPTLTVAGQVLTGAGVGSPLAAVDALRLTWGRASVLDVPTPATLALSALDSAAGAPFARRNDLIGQPVFTGWAASDGFTVTTFRGRITDVGVTPHPAGFLATLAASSVETDLANYTVPEGTTWPAETFTARAARIAGMFPANFFTGGIVLPDRLDLGMPDLATPSDNLPSLTAAAADVSGRNALDLLRQLFASMSPLPMIYDPNADRITFAPRHRYAWSPGVGWTASAALLSSADHGGRWVAASLGGRHLDGHATGYTGTLGQALNSRVTRVEVSYLDATAAGAQRTATATTVDSTLEGAVGRRVLSVDSIHSDAAKAAQLAGLYADMVNREGRSRRLAAVGWDEEREPLHDSGHAVALLSGAETPGAVFLGRTWLPRLGSRPLVAVIGATVTYAAGQWSAEVTPAPVIVAPDGFGAWAPATIASAKPTLKLSDVDPSVTFGDLGYIDVGPGYTTATGAPFRGNPT